MLKTEVKGSAIYTRQAPDSPDFIRKVEVNVSAGSRIVVYVSSDMCRNGATNLDRSFRSSQLRLFMPDANTLNSGEATMTRSEAKSLIAALNAILADNPQIDG